MPANVSPEYSNAEKQYLMASTDEQRFLALEEMMRTMPKHKSAESLRKNIRTRYKKLKQKLAKAKKKKAGKEGIRKEGIQVVLIGITNSGKSSLISILTNAKPEIAPYEFTTKQPIIGTLDYQGIKFQIIDLPAVNYETFDQGLANTADILLITITNQDELPEILPFLEKSTGKKIIALNKSDKLTSEQIRKQEARLKSKKFDFVTISCKTKYGINELKDKLLENSGTIRIYTKQPGKPADEKPVTMPPNSTVQDVAKKIFPKTTKIKQARITGPSSKFPNQQVGLTHILKDKDIVEFYTD